VCSRGHRYGVGAGGGGLSVGFVWCGGGDLVMTGGWGGVWLGGGGGWVGGVFVGGG